IPAFFVPRREAPQTMKNTARAALAESAQAPRGSGARTEDRRQTAPEPDALHLAAGSCSRSWLALAPFGPGRVFQVAPEADPGGRRRAIQDSARNSPRRTRPPLKR